MNNRYKYIGRHPKLQSKTAIGRYVNGVFMVQVDQRPSTIDGVRWAYGWHKADRKDWAAR